MDEIAAITNGAGDSVGWWIEPGVGSELVD
jgi:hypothetical protein